MGVDISAIVISGILTALFVLWLLESSKRKSHPVTGGPQSDRHIAVEASLTIFANPFSHCSRKVALAAAESGLVHDYKSVHLIETGSYENIAPAYLQVNPAGLLPTLVHDHVPIYESDAILDYLDRLSDKNSLRPSASEQAAEMQHWIDFCSIDSANPMGARSERAGACIPALTLPLFATMIEEIPLRQILVGLLFHPDKKRPAFFLAAKLLGLKKIVNVRPLKAILQATRHHMLAHLKTIDAALASSDGPWILGAQFSLADITLGVIYYRLDETGWLAHYREQEPLLAVFAHYAALQARPSWHTALEARQLAIIERGSAKLKQAVADDESVRNALYGI